MNGLTVAGFRILRGGMDRPLKTELGDLVFGLDYSTDAPDGCIL